MSTLGTVLRDVLTDDLPATYRVVGGPVDGVTTPTVAVYPSRLEHLAQAPNGRYALTLTVDVMVGNEVFEKAEEALLDALEDVLVVLWRRGDFLLESGERVVTQDAKFHAWSLTVRAGFTTPTEE